MKPKPLTLTTRSADETSLVGERLGRVLEAGDVVALHGELGAGKTTLVKGVARGLGVPRRRAVTSPTFVLIGEHEGRVKMYHLDWYRLDRVAGEDALLAEECFSAPAVTLVEWASRGTDVLPDDRLEVTIAHAGGDKRTIRAAGTGERGKSLAQALKGSK